MRLFIYEIISAGGLGPTVPASLREEGAAMLSAIVADFQRVPGVEVTTLPSAPVEAPHAFRRMAAGCDAALIIAPEFDDLLAGRTEVALEAGCRLLGSSPDSIRLAADKLRLAADFQERRVPTPNTWLAEEALPPDVCLPLVCKPRHGAGSQATYLVRQRADWRDIWVEARKQIPRDDLLIQPFVEGLAASVAILRYPHASLKTPGTTQRLSDDGRFQYLGGSTPLPSNLGDRAISLAMRALDSIPGLHGYVGVDLVLGEAADGSKDVVIEINPRLTTSYIGLSKLTDTNLAELWWRLAHGEVIESPVWSDGVIAFTPAGAIFRAAALAR